MEEVDMNDTQPIDTDVVAATAYMAYRENVGSELSPYEMYLEGLITFDYYLRVEAGLGKMRVQHELEKSLIDLIET